MDPENEEEGDSKRIAGSVGRYYSFPSSRIVRVTRASGGKDRHSKVLTSKGLRDRRVRLSVNTAIQFYDLQDRLGYDQPNKAVEWLLKAAASSIAELPPISSPFPGTPRELSDYKRSEDGDRRQQVTKSSACSSNSENSRECSRSENRIKPRLRTKAKEKEKDNNEFSYVLNPVYQTPSFTELLNGGGLSNSITPSNRGPNFFQKSPRYSWSSSTPMDYFSSGLEFTPDSIVSVAGDSNRGRGYNLNFTISSPGFNRGTLQSNSSLPHLQRFSPTDPSQTGFPVEHHHQFLSGFSMHTANKGTGKS